MDIKIVLYAVAIVGALGLFFGIMLSIAAKKLQVERSEEYAPLLELLPGANCSGCGFAGCGQLAEALLAGKAEPDACPVGGPEVAQKVADLLGIQLTKNTRMTAMVRCSGGIRARKKFDYDGIIDCHAAMGIGGGPNECNFGCLGMGSCVGACKFGAISIDDGVAVVDHERCTGCKACVRACPKNIIITIPYTADVVVACSSRDKGANLRRMCEIGCLGCSICQRACKQGAIKVVDNLASIDYEKCTGCGDCAEKCPRKLIVDAKLEAGAWRPAPQASETSAT